MSSTHYKVYIGLDLYAHLLDLLDEDGCSYIDHKSLQSLKLVIPSMGIIILVFLERSFKCKEANYGKRLASPLLAS